MSTTGGYARSWSKAGQQSERREFELSLVFHHPFEEKGLFCWGCWEVEPEEGRERSQDRKLELPSSTEYRVITLCWEELLSWRFGDICIGYFWCDSYVWRYQSLSLAPGVGVYMCNFGL